MASAWLDRLSAPAPASRRASPASRKPALAQSRPSLESRSTSLSVLARTNSSASSSVGTNGIKTMAISSLRQELSRPLDVQDPLQVLQEIIGHAAMTNELGQEATFLGLAVSDLHDGVDFNGMSLEEFVEQHGEEKRLAEVTTQTIQTVEDYEKERNKFEDLHKTIAKCDDVLKSVEISLASFQEDLGAVSSEIEALQDRSTALTTRLDNRRVVEKMLGPAAEEVSISPVIVKTLSEGPINEDWTKSLSELDRVGKVIDNKLNEPSTIQAAKDVKPILDNLRNKTNERIRDHIVAQIKAMRSPNINAQIIQQNSLARYREIFTFLFRHQKKLAEEIAQAYSNTMRWYYLDHFSRYRQALEKLKVVPIGKEDTIGSDPSISRGARPGASSALFDLGRRAEIINSSHGNVISSYLAAEDKSNHHLEMPYCNFIVALVDNVCVEYQFVAGFFSSLPYRQTSRTCAEIFTPTLNLSREMTQMLLDTSTLDCLGILLCIRATQKLAFELQRRRVPVMDDHINGLLILLWPMFQKAMDAHIESMRALSATLSARSAASKLTFSMTGSSSSADALAKASMAPHFLTQRFGQFLYGILAISQESGDDEPVASSLARMRAEFESFLTKAAKSAGGADKAKRERFIENQLVLIETIISDAEGKLAKDAKAWLNEIRAKVAVQR